MYDHIAQKLKQCTLVKILGTGGDSTMISSFIFINQSINLIEKANAPDYNTEDNYDHLTEDILHIYRKKKVGILSII